MMFEKGGIMDPSTEPQNCNTIICGAFGRVIGSRQRQFTAIHGHEVS